MQTPPLSSGTRLENDAIHVMKVAVGIAPSIWESMEGLVGDIVWAKSDVSEALISAKALAKSLSDNIKMIRESDTKVPCGDATVFVRVCLSAYSKIDM